MARFNEEQLKEARNIIAPYVDPVHCETFNAKIPLSVLNCADKFEQVEAFHNKLVQMCFTLFKDFKFEKPVLRQYTNSLRKPAIFVIWLQDEMPEIVQYCLDSFDDSRFELTIVSDKTADIYISVNPVIRDLYRTGKICPADYSDYLRVKLLEKYNGIYFDASCLIVSKIPDYVWTKPYWSVKGDYQKNTSPIAMLHFNFGQVYAMGGYDNTIYSYVAQLMEYYYTYHEYAFSYYLMYYLFEYVYRIDNDVKFDVDMLCNNNEDVEQLAYHLDNLEEASKYRDTFFYKLRASDEYTDAHYKFFNKL